MKHFLLVVIILIYSSNSFTQTSISLQEIEKDLINSYKKIIYERSIMGEDTNYVENIEKLNNEFKDKMINYLSKFPLTLSFSFDSLKKYISIVTSEDGLFRIYSWNTFLGGTMEDFANIVQYKTDNNIQIKFYHDSSGNGNYISYYSEIYTLISNNKKYYLAIGFGKFSKKNLATTVKAFLIDKNELIDTIKIFKTNQNLENEILIEYDYFQNHDYFQRQSKVLIKYDDKKKILYIPYVEESGKIAKKKIKYIFNGKFFDPIN